MIQKKCIKFLRNKFQEGSKKETKVRSRIDKGTIQKSKNPIKVSAFFVATTIEIYHPVSRSSRHAHVSVARIRSIRSGLDSNPA